MFTSLANCLSLNLVGDGPIGYAILESFVIHVRSIIYFLYSDKPKLDDVLAEDFFDRPDKWKNIRPELSSQLRNVKYRVGKEIAHLTYQRFDISSEAKQLKLLNISNEISNIMNIFLGNVPAKKMSKIWQNKNQNQPNSEL